MKNKFFYIICFALSFFTFQSLNSNEIFNFNITEIEITEDGNLFKGKNGGEAYTNDGISITAKNFEYNKSLLYLKATDGVEYKDEKKNTIIKADQISYFKNEEKIFAKGNVLVLEKGKNLEIKADDISVFKIDGTITADGNVNYRDKINEIEITTDKITYLQKIDKIFTEGETYAEIQSKYKFNSNDVLFLKRDMKLSSSKKTTIEDKNNSLYELDSFSYEINNEFLKGKNVKIIENSKVQIKETNTYFFESGFFDLKNKVFNTGETKISLKKNIFDRSDNDPRLYGISSNHRDGITTVKKASFTSCSKNNKCPPWHLEASEIKHDKNKKQLIYENSILKFYDFPIIYFPKFFHPDPTVERQSGFLIPKLNNSNILGSSFNIPYFKVISEDKDYTVIPTFFSNNSMMIQNEYRQENKDSSLIADFGLVNNFKSTETNKKKNISHLFANFKKKLNFEKFLNSDLSIFIERTTKDTYLKVFSDNLYENKIKPKNQDILNSGFDVFLETENFSFTGGANVYEDLTKIHSDRYQFVLPYYNYSQNSLSTKFGSLGLTSKGDNILDNTNNVKSRIINDLNFSFNDKIFEIIPIKNNFNLYFKNLNSLGKKVDKYKSSPQIELQSLFEINSELPMIKNDGNFKEILMPKLSFRINPGDMKNHSTDERTINANNIFSINRLGVDDSLESGNSITVGIDYKKENIKNKENYLEFKIATVFRDDIENNIPTQTTLNQKNSNIFGAIDYSLSENFIIDYNYAIDNKFENFKYNSIGLDLSLNNFITEFRFIEEDSDLGNTNVFENTTKYIFDEKNTLTFKTRRNREINITEYYNLVYEYKNDCLTAGIRFNKSYYEDRDLKPTENLMFTISFFPLTTIEQTLN